MKIFNLVLVLLLAASATPAADGIDYPKAEGIIGIDAGGGASWLAVRIDVPEGMALAGFAWYNNDDATAFPGVYLGTGYDRGPAPMDEALQVGGAFGGAADSWSQLDFVQPVAASLGNLFVIFAFPEGPVYARRGSGGGPGVGYVAGDGGSRGWISGDGESWLALSAGYGFAVLPRFVAADGAVLAKALRFDGSSAGGEPRILKDFLQAAPNPFNPQTRITYGLKIGQDVNVEVFDLRGRLVMRLFDGFQEAGEHEAVWRGEDSSGRRVASGVYFVRMHGSDVALTRRVMLLK